MTTSSLARRLVALLLPLAAAAPAAGAAPGGDGDGPPVDVTCIGTMAPAVVHVRCVAPRDAAGGPAGSPLDYRYEWDFGDPAGRWNELPGWNAAHVYDRPGQYTITLTCRAAGGRETYRRVTVRVAPDDRRRVYASADGNDALDGANPARAVRSAGRAFELAAKAADAWVLLRRGDVYDVSRPIHLGGRGLRVGSYARGGDPDDWSKGVQLKPVPGAAVKPRPADPLPVLRKVAAPPRSESIFYVAQGSADTLFDGVEFDSEWGLKGEYGLKKVPARAFTVGGTNFAVRGCSFRNLTDGLNTELKPTGVLVTDCHFGEEIRGYGIYSTGFDHAYVGNVMVHSRQEHLIRATEPGVVRVLIAYNHLSRPNKNKGSVELRMASWFTVAGNYLNDGTLRVGPLEQDQRQYPNWRDIKCEWGIIQDNRLDDLFLNVRLGTYHVTFRNNVIRNNPRPGPPKPTDGDWMMSVECEKPGYDAVRKVGDVRIEHNTVINHVGRGSLLYLHGRPQGLVVRNNVYLTDGKGNANALFVTAPDLEGVEVADNVFPPGKAGTHHVNKVPVPRGEWAKSPHVRGERYGQVPVDADDNVPIETGAGAKLGTDRSERERRKAG